MEEQPETTGVGSSVDNDAGGQKPDPQPSGPAQGVELTNQLTIGCSMFPTLTQSVLVSPQAAAPPPGTCPHCGAQRVEPAAEMTEDFESAQASVDPNTLQELKWEMQKCLKGDVHKDQLKDCITKSSVDQRKLLLFFRAWNDQEKKFSEGRSSSSSSSSSFLKPFRVKVFPLVSGQTFGAEKVILEKVASMTLQVVNTGQEECDIIIVFCPIRSRAGSDVQAAMRRVTGDKPVILVLMHHTRDVDFPAEVTTWSENYQKVELEVHVLFHETQLGLLVCGRNEQAVDQIKKVLHKHSKIKYLPG
uniref:uncharacterized protein LOC124066873 isoform X2 n=1 Tax=Scatophagus argus TaxID=75038 RepID=UPI001ED83F56|nr:uncharacterized protein LOC124066873 isoform X2 [Scatophagus argus]